MRFRFKAFAWHLAGSASALTLTLGLLYLGWYHWPGWYLADMPTVLAILVGVDVVLGPLLTFIIADPAKTRRVLARDVGAILLVQPSGTAGPSITRSL
jgi:predicted anti-sigma-YlaC factor YlaD